MQTVTPRIWDFKLPSNVFKLPAPWTFLYIILNIIHHRPRRPCIWARYYSWSWSYTICYTRAWQGWGPSANRVGSGRVELGEVKGQILRNLCGPGRVTGQPKFSEICCEDIGSAGERMICGWSKCCSYARKERKGTRTCIAPIVITTSKRSDVDHTELPPNTQHLPFLRISIR